MFGDSFNFKVRFYLKFRLVFIAKRWAKGFGIEDKDVEERKNIYVYVRAHIRSKKRKEKKERRKKERKIQGKGRRI
jgi:hypothetical protein